MSRTSGSVGNTLDIEGMVARRQKGFSLEGAFYSSPEVYDLDLEVIFGKHWLFCGTEAEIPEPGDYITVQFGKTSVIVIRDDDEEVAALLNVCRHRGARIVEDVCGSVGNLVCPYHQWTYRPDGELIHAEATGPDFDRSQFGLKKVHVRSIAGLMFICLAEEPPADIDDAAAVIEPYVAPYRLASLKVAAQTDLVEDGNWKLTMENNRECLHCDAGHPELTSAYFPFLRSDDADVTPRQRPHWERFVQASKMLDAARAKAGIPADIHRKLDDRATAFQVTHLALDGAGKSFGVDGTEVSRKLIGDIDDPVFGDMSVHFQPNTWLHFLSDHAIVFSALPVAPDKTLVRTTWLVHPDAVEGVDYDVDTLTKVWKATNEQDCGFVEKAQRGTEDPGYVPGPYATIEKDVDAFVTWYIGRLEEHFGGGRDRLEVVRAAGE